MRICLYRKADFSVLWPAVGNRHTIQCQRYRFDMQKLNSYNSCSFYGTGEKFSFSEALGIEESQCINNKGEDKTTDHEKIYLQAGPHQYFEPD